MSRKTVFEQTIIPQLSHNCPAAVPQLSRRCPARPFLTKNRSWAKMMCLDWIYYALTNVSESNKKNARFSEAAGPTKCISLFQAHTVCEESQMGYNLDDLIGRFHCSLTIALVLSATFAILMGALKDCKIMVNKSMLSPFKFSSFRSNLSAIALIYFELFTLRPFAQGLWMLPCYNISEVLIAAIVVSQNACLPTKTSIRQTTQ